MACASYDTYRTSKPYCQACIAVNPFIWKHIRRAPGACKLCSPCSSYSSSANDGDGDLCSLCSDNSFYYAVNDLYFTVSRRGTLKDENIRHRVRRLDATRVVAGLLTCRQWTKPYKKKGGRNNKE